MICDLIFVINITTPYKSISYVEDDELPEEIHEESIVKSLLGLHRAC